MSAEHPDRRTHSFILSERDGVWAVAKVALPPGSGGPPQPGAPGAPQPLHDQDGPRLPGGTPNWSVGF
jgi:hypothetical protein